MQKTVIGGKGLEINVMTFNIHHGRGTDRKLNLERIAKVIQESKADLVSLNEVDRHFSKRSDYIDQVSWLAKYLEMNHAFGEAYTLQSKDSTVLRQYGNAFLSRYPIVLEKNHLLTFNRFTENRSLLEIGVQLPKQLFKVYVTHLNLNPFIHKKQTNFIVGKIEEDSQPVVIMGDWNMKPEVKAWKKMTRHFIDVCYAAGKGTYCTFPSFRPKLQLDYIFVSPDIHVASVEVVEINSSASDHLLLKTTLLFNR
ncbi:endonuclease/exonuclease/phosphatase family protein [Aneurinibacillus tyrosinisolvens]|uniref:endonuclease/exonuclease/phosphatase family protein n=1 Tax=Aneurinibacillus tyrosinisolvens TaxID=1443435 RepID=UPI00063F0CEF|nr:endonuclease/exonuclease/phosphatase family protein [Aneurinibacillus tyrosinisolvens]